MTWKSLIVVALGGNAISRSDEEGTVDQQFANSRRTAKALADLVEAGHHIVVTHGNGPQIGNFLLRNEAAADRIYPLPMEVADAHVEGGMGFMIAQTLTNELRRRGDTRMAATIITTVLVDAGDPSFRHPTKPIGRQLSRDELEKFSRGDEHWDFIEIGPGRFRRVVPSPPPLRIMEIETIRRSVYAGDLLVACGGGGVPVVQDPHTGLRGVRAIIDKDLASALLAVELSADAMLILTSVDRVKLHFGKPAERAIERMTADEARRYLAAGEFPPGSMGPKIQAALNFLARAPGPDAFVAIGPLEQAADVLAGRAGTRIE